jgi:hypothetical protein
LVELWEDASHFGFPLAPLAPANSVDWKQRNHVFEDMAALMGDLYALTGAGAPEQIEGSPVTANLFPLNADQTCVAIPDIPSSSKCAANQCACKL